jgi:hypothetical protein
MRDNILHQVGDVLVITIDAKITGKVNITNFVDDLDGITESRRVEKEFRISEDGLFWGDWKTLTSENLSEESYIVDGILFIQVRYTRVGEDVSGEITFNNIDFSGSREEIQFIAPTINSSIFANIIGSDGTKHLERNLFKKLYYRGIIPKYIIRAENNDKKEDRDYIDLFFSIARFFAMIFRFFKRFENFRNDYDLLREQVRQYGIYFDESNITLEELQFLAQNIFDQIRQRGTDMMFKRKGYVLPSGNEVEMDGEFLRLCRIKEMDELLYEYIPLEKVGWCMRQCSPMYRGTCMSVGLNKTKEMSSNFINLDDFYLSKTGNDSYYTIAQWNDKRVLHLSTRNNGVVGLGRQSDSEDASDYLYIADSKLDYEITFAFALEGFQDATIEFGVEGFDSRKNKLNDAFITLDGLQITETFANIGTTNRLHSLMYYVRGRIHSYSTQFVQGDKLNIGEGKNLCFNNPFVKYILPKIQVTSSSQASILIYDYKIRPLVRGTNIIPLRDGSINNHSLGFIQSSYLFYAYIRNNNNSLSEAELTDIIRKYLLPFNVTDIMIFLSKIK